MNVRPGQVVAIVGHSGSGKSTVCALLERFYEPETGSIKIDSVEINELSPKWLRTKAIGYISQVTLFLNQSYDFLVKPFIKGAGSVCYIN